MTEVFKTIEQHPAYLVSNLGRVASAIGKKILKHSITGDGYPCISLSHKGKTWTRTVHRLVAKAFIENPDDKAEVNHRDGVKTNNSVDNLEWLTHDENMEHATRSGLIACGENGGGARLTESQAQDILDNYDSWGISRRDAGRRFGVHHATIDKILWRNTWKHLTQSKRTA